MVTRPVKTIVASLLAMALLAGCVRLGPDFSPPESRLDQQWSNPDASLFKAGALSKESLAKWWSRFEDPVLDTLVHQAIEGNLPLQASALRIMEARALVGFAQGNLYPQLQQASAYITENGSTAPSFDRYFTSAWAGFDAAWELDLWGRYGRAVESAQATLEASIQDYEAMLVSLTAEVARLYVSIRTLEERIRLARRNGEIQRKSLELVELQLEAGLVTELDLMQARSLLTSTLSTIPRMEATLAANKHALAVLLGLPPDEIHEILGAPGRIPEPPEAVEVGIPADILRHRPDVRRAEMLAAAQCARIGIAEADLYPSFTLVGTIGLSGTDRGSRQLGDLLDSDGLTYSFGPSFTWNVLNYGRIKNLVRIEDARFQQALTQYQQTVLDAAREVEDAMKGLFFARREAELLKKGVEYSRRSMELSMLQYEEGFVDYQRVLDSSRSLTQKQDQYAQVRGDIATYTIALFKALGGGWEPGQGLPYLPEEVKRQMEDRTDWGTLLD